MGAKREDLRARLRRNKSGKASWVSVLGRTLEITHPGEETVHRPAAQVVC